MQKKVSIIIPVYNSLEFTKLCMEYLQRNTPADLYECIIVNNGSDDGTKEYLESLSADVKVVNNSENLGFAKACNGAVKQATQDLILFLNNDTVPQQNWLEPLIEEMQDKEAGIAGSLLYYPDLTVQHAGVVFDHSQTPYHIYSGIPLESECVQKARDFKAVTGACLITRKSLFEDLGGFDERYINCGEDTDYCLKVHAKGFRTRYQPASQLMHFESRTTGRQDNVLKARETFVNTWFGKVEQDDLGYLVPDGMRMKVNQNGTFTFMTELEQEAELSVKKQRAWLYHAAQKTRESFAVYTDIYSEYPYDLDVLQHMKMLCKIGGLHEDKQMFESVINKMTFSKEYSV